MEDVVAIHMDKSGKPKLKLETPKLVHYKQGDVTEIIDPHVTIYRDSPEPWHVWSHFAKATQGIEMLRFWDNVRVQHSNDIKTPFTLIKTSTLMVYPNKHLASTEQLITLTQPNLTVEAIGMLANINSGDIKLLSNARGQYVPNN